MYRSIFKQFLLTIVTISLSGLATPTFAQPGGPPAAQESKSVAPIVHEDNTVTFSVKMPNAEQAHLFSWELRPFYDGQESFPMTLEADSIWRTTVGPLPPGVYDYWFDLDKLRITDPMGRNVYGERAGSRDFFEVPGPEGQPRHDEWRKDVPHGALTSHWYPSAATEEQRRAHVYTPPGYQQNTDKIYPVFYLLHGAGDHDAVWTSLGRAHVILDNLIADGKAEPMVVVMPDGMPGMTGEMRWPMNGMHEKFEDDILNYLMPYIDARYRIRTDSEGRAIAGLSMGGGQTLSLSLSKPDLFSQVGAFSSATFRMGSVMEELDGEAINEKLDLLWIAIGKDDFLLQPHKQFIAELEANKIDHEYQLTEGYHMWSVWRDYLAEFVPRLFKER